MSLAKEEWELSRLKALREEEERRAELEEDEVLYTYSRDDAFNQVKKKSKANRPTAPVRQSNRKSLVSTLPGNDSDSVKYDSAKSSRISSRRSSIASSCSSTASLSTDSFISSQPSSPEEPPRHRGPGRPRKDGKQKRRYDDDDDWEVPNKSVKLAHVDKPNTRKHKPTMFDEDLVNQGKRLTPKAQPKPNTLRTPIPTKKMPGKSTPKINNTTPKPTKTSPGLTSPKASTPVLQPWSNPNLVIRTRRASTQQQVTDESSGSESTPVRPTKPPKVSPIKDNVNTPAKVVNVASPPVSVLQRTALPASPIATSQIPQAVYLSKSPIITRPAVTQVVMSTQGIRPTIVSQSVVRSPLRPTTTVRPAAPVVVTQASVAALRANTITPILTRTAELMKEGALTPTVTTTSTTQQLRTTTTQQLPATFRIGGQLGSVSIVNNKAVFSQGLPILSTTGTSIRPLLSGNTRFILNTANLVTRTVPATATSQATVSTQVVNNTARVNNTVPILEKMAMQLSVANPQASSSQPTASKVTPARSLAPAPAKQTVAQLIAAKPSTSTGQVITRPLIAQIVPGKQGMAQIVATKQQVGGVTQLVAKQPVSAHLVNQTKPITQVVQARPGTQIQTKTVPVLQGRQLAQVVRTSGITQLVQGGKQIIRTSSPASQVHQVIQQGRQQFVVVSGGGDTGQRSRLVFIQQPTVTGQAKLPTIKTIQTQTVVCPTPQSQPSNSGSS